MRARRSPEGGSASISACIWLRHLPPSLVPQMPRRECRVPRISASRCRSPSNGAAASWPREGPARHAEMRMRAATRCLDMSPQHMPFQCAGSKAPAACRSGPEQGSGLPDDLRQAAGELEIAQALGFEPPEIVQFIVQDHLAGTPARRERHDQIMPAAGGPRNHLAPPGKPYDLDFQGGLLVDLAMQRGVQGFAEFNPAARQRVIALGRRPRAANQQDLVIAEDRRAHGQLRVWRGRRPPRGLMEAASASEAPLVTPAPPPPTALTPPRARP